MQQFISDYKAGMIRYNQFRGRTSVGAFWRFVAVNVVIQILLALLGTISSLLLIAWMVYWLVLIVPSIAIAVRRLHDTGRTGWFILLGLIPIVGVIILIVFYVQGSDGPNEYGQGPDDSLDPSPAW